MNLVRSSVLMGAGTVIASVANLGVGVMLGRWLSPDGLGQYALIASTATLLGILGSMGLGGSSIYHINRLGMDQKKATTIIVRLSMSAGVVFALLASVAVRYEAYFGALPEAAAIAAALLVLGKLVLPASMHLLIASMRVKSYVFIQTGSTVFLVLFLTPLALAGELTLGTALWSAAAGQIVTVVWLLWLLRRDFDWRRPFRWDDQWPLLKYGGLINLAHFIYIAGMEGGLFIVRLFMPVFDEVGFFQVALRLSSVVPMAGLAFGPLLFRKFATSDDEARPLHVERTLRVFWFWVTATVTVLIFLSGPIIGLLFTPEFEPAVPVLQVMLVGMAAMTLMAPVYELFYSVGAVKWVIFVRGMTALAMIGFMYFLVPAHAAVGAAWSFVVANAINLVVTYVVAHKLFHVRIRSCFILNTTDVRFILTNLRSSVPEGAEPSSGTGAP